MKTPIQILIDKINERIFNVKNNSDEFDTDSSYILTTLKVIKSDCELLLHHEQEQIEIAFNEGMGNSVAYFNPPSRTPESENYYNQTYNQNPNQ